MVNASAVPAYVIIDFRIPFPPSVNHLYATVRGRRVLSAKGRTYHARVLYEARRQIGATWETLTGRLGIKITLHPPDRRRRDISNCVKIIEDSMTKARVWHDDSQIDVLHVLRGEVSDPGYASVMVWVVQIRAAVRGEI